MVWLLLHNFSIALNLLRQPMPDSNPLFAVISVVNSQVQQHDHAKSTKLVAVGVDSLQKVVEEEHSSR